MTWEHKIIEVPVTDGSSSVSRTEQELNELAKEGWEVIAVVPNHDFMRHFIYLRRLLGEFESLDY